VKGVVIPFSNDKVAILYSDNEIYLMQLGLEIKSTPLKFSEVLEDQSEKIT
jgi:hypothetical protein